MLTTGQKFIRQCVRILMLDESCCALWVLHRDNIKNSVLKFSFWFCQKTLQFCRNLGIEHSLRLYARTAARSINLQDSLFQHFFWSSYFFLISNISPDSLAWAGRRPRTLARMPSPRARPALIRVLRSIGPPHGQLWEPLACPCSIPSQSSFSGSGIYHHIILYFPSFSQRLVLPPTRLLQTD